MAEQNRSTLKATALQNYVIAFENLNVDNLENGLGRLLAEQVFFKDPFNAVTGRTETLAIFKHMFATLKSPKFKVISAAQDQNNPQIGLLYWQFNFVLPSNSSAQEIDGMSRVSFDESGLVIAHIDYWDAGEQVYAKVPVLGWGIRQVIKRLAASS